MFERERGEILGPQLTGRVATCTHSIFSGPAIERLNGLYNEGVIKGVIGTDTVIHENRMNWYHEVSVAPLFGDVIYRIENNMSVSDLLD